jgi:hypothetical protein
MKKGKENKTERKERKDKEGIDNDSTNLLCFWIFFEIV